MLNLRAKVSVQARTKVGRLINGIRLETEKIAVKEIEDAADETIASMQKYPAPLPKQKYVRTYLFRDSWKKKRADSKTRKGFVITNTARKTYKSGKKGKPYGVYVVGNAKGEMQNQKYHAGRWQLFKVVLEVAMKLAQSRIAEKIRLYIADKRLR